jgi:hypothetical protein
MPPNWFWSTWVEFQKKCYNYVETSEGRYRYKIVLYPGMDQVDKRFCKLHTYNPEDVDETDINMEIHIYQKHEKELLVRFTDIVLETFDMDYFCELSGFECVRMGDMMFTWRVLILNSRAATDSFMEEMDNVVGCKEVHYAYKMTKNEIEAVYNTVDKFDVCIYDCETPKIDVVGARRKKFEIRKGGIRVFYVNGEAFIDCLKKGAEHIKTWSKKETRKKKLKQE